MTANLSSRFSRTSPEVTSGPRNELSRCGVSGNVFRSSLTPVKSPVAEISISIGMCQSSALNVTTGRSFSVNRGSMLDSCVFSACLRSNSTGSVGAFVRRIE